ncbi:formate dehydrogenase [Paenibacillus swuensis]|uniref:Sulfur carrier protein FdhD n=1 Tax=Paenibacillus swuensis TaxID=1178515 RepID=A0A172TPX6_9BACL|nr:formate dehydrogenase accessory sulfurtransferase FdhD [Paenibacillus swuensis]ANE49111.1 formate dehydrogenase [Paenibacillus swuensis]
MLFRSQDRIATEWPLTIKVNGEEFATLVCTPSDLLELTYGFLASEGWIRTSNDVSRVDVDEGTGFAHVELHRKNHMRSGDHSKRWIGSCCGKSRQFYLRSDVQTARTIMTSVPITVETCFQLMNALQRESADFEQTGGVHNAALCGSDGLFLVRSDIGRHNALDKLYGYCLLHRISMRDKVIAFSGRMSSEVVLKAAKMGAGILLSKSAPTDLALKLANDLNITTVGFIRGNRLNVYTHPERILDTAVMTKEEPL